MRGRRHIAALFAVAAGLAMLLSACDATTPDNPEILVVEGYLNTDEPFGAVTVHRTGPMSSPFDEVTQSVQDATVLLTLDEVRIAFTADPDRPGRYLSTRDVHPHAGQSFRVSVMSGDGRAVASGKIPPRIEIADISTTVPEAPVEAVLLDSLQVDSLQTGARSTYVYPVEVTVAWEPLDASSAADSTHWIRAQLKPYTTPTPGVVTLFFKSEQILRESTVRIRDGLRCWTGVYLVPVDEMDDPLPPHSLKVSLVRSGEEYARFASTRGAPDRREPSSNVEGGVGMVAGISVDSLVVQL